MIEYMREEIEALGWNFEKFFFGHEGALWAWDVGDRASSLLPSAQCKVWAWITEMLHCAYLCAWW
jgi:hypothetical protein